MPQKRYVILNEGYIEGSYQFLLKKKQTAFSEKTVPRTN